MNRQTSKNRYFYGLGTIGRDMVYTLISMFLMFYLSDVLMVSKSTMWMVTIVFMIFRVFDAFNDPFMGVLVDNTKSKFGKFKPWILSGALFSGLFTILMFVDFGLDGVGFVIAFAIIYLLWEISFTANDIAYWSMLPSLSQDQKEREKIGSIARIFANIGLFTLVVAIKPVTAMLSEITGSMKHAYFVLAIILVIIMWLFQLFTLFGVKEDKSLYENSEHTSFKDMFSIILKNDQLLWTAVSMALFMIGYTTTTSFGEYYFKYVFGDETKYSIFALVLGVSQIAALLIFPRVSLLFTRKKMYFFATILVIMGYIIFFFSQTSITTIVIAGVLLFVGQAFIQLLMLMFIADTVEYGELKLGQRNDSVTLSLQPLINKIGGAIATGIVGSTVILSGMKDATSHLDMTQEGLFLFKFSMLILPLILILIGYLVYARKYIINEITYKEILESLQEKKDVNEK